MNERDHAYVQALHQWARAYHDHKDRLCHEALAVGFAIFVALLWPRAPGPGALALDAALVAGLLLSFTVLARQTAYKQAASFLTRLGFLALGAADGQPAPGPDAALRPVGRWKGLLPPVDPCALAQSEFVPPFLRETAASIDGAKCAPPYDHRLVAAHFAMAAAGLAVLAFRAWSLWRG